MRPLMIWGFALPGDDGVPIVLVDSESGVSGDKVKLAPGIFDHQVVEYNGHHQGRFWSLVRSFLEEQKADLLSFNTGWCQLYLSSEEAASPKSKTITDIQDPKALKRAIAQARELAKVHGDSFTRTIKMLVDGNVRGALRGYFPEFYQVYLTGPDHMRFTPIFDVPAFMSLREELREKLISAYEKSSAEGARMAGDNDAIQDDARKLHEIMARFHVDTDVDEFSTKRKRELKKLSSEYEHFSQALSHDEIFKDELNKIFLSDRDFQDEVRHHLIEAMTQSGGDIDLFFSYDPDRGFSERKTIQFENLTPFEEFADMLDSWERACDFAIEQGYQMKRFSVWEEQKEILISLYERYFPDLLP